MSTPLYTKPRETQILDEGNAESNASSTPTVKDASLHLVIEAWPTLSESLKEQVLALISDELQG